LIQTATLLPSMQGVPTATKIQIPVDFKVFLIYYSKVSVPHTVIKFLLDQGIKCGTVMGQKTSICGKNSITETIHSD
jgi:hypothetical protein